VTLHIKIRWKKSQTCAGLAQEKMIVLLAYLLSLAEAGKIVQSKAVYVPAAAREQSKSNKQGLTGDPCF
jgi:hypothetical protein